MKEAIKEGIKNEQRKECWNEIEIEIEFIRRQNTTIYNTCLTICTIQQ